MSITPPAAFRLYLLRHAKAGWASPGQKDFDRTLDGIGFAEAEIVANRAADRQLVPELILCSTAVRCRQTADAYRRAMSEDLDIRYIDALYDGTANVYQDIIVAHAKHSSVMVVGHNPVLEEILHASLGQQAAEAIPAGYPPGALAAIDFTRQPFDGLLPNGTLAEWIEPETQVR